MAFFAWQNQRNRQTQAEKARLVEMERAAEIARREADIEKVNQQKEIINAFRIVAEQQGATPEQAAAIATQQYAQFIASHPEAVTTQNQATSALSRVKKTGYEAQQPLAAKLGQTEAEASIGERIAQGAEAMNRFNVARERAVSQPMAAQAADFEAVEKSKLGTDLTSAMRSRAGELARSEVGRDIAKNTYDSTMFSKIDPEMAAQAQNAGYGAAAARGNLAKELGGLEVAPVPIDPYSALYPELSSMLQRRLKQPRPVAPTGALPNRILTLEDLR